jgi:DUF2892 family protein
LRAAQVNQETPTMTKNIGQIDRIARAAIGIALIAWALTGGPVWAWIGILPLATAGISFCPAYRLFGLHT